ncbi:MULTISPECIES: hypothetical protein [spotted fever group]|uniref:Uncharacterized protein n=1 Tax=Rickettsia tamurae subsp. buchneri TaxID=1462938 RepID=A0A8E0WK99_9RICK|nr:MULTISPECIES: hypothetical protein [spotted fever group]EER20763.1 hypothetical protein REIS_2273 [Rickettsia endosymbiont of Ixodes scapularis]KDO02132.1 hypothetical protein REISMN_08745 [Rickettsia tamurae subsp. buchneri]
MNQNQISNNEPQQSTQGEILRAEVHKPQISRTVIIILFLIFLIGYCCGHICSRMFNNPLEKMQILYVSRSEIMDLEKARVEHSQDSEGRMFFGEINKAISLIREESMKHENNYNRVIFVGDDYVEGRNTHSISKEVYEKVIHRLKKPKDSL